MQMYTTFSVLKSWVSVYISQVDFGLGIAINNVVLHITFYVFYDMICDMI
jgi:hypothetical protein